MKIRGNRWTLSDGVAGTVLLVVPPACALILLALPRPVAPTELPCLWLDATQVAQVLRRDRAAVKASPISVPAIRLRQLFLEEGAAERSLTASFPTFQQRRLQIRRSLAELRRASGEASVLALRADAVAQFESSLDSKLPAEQGERWMGSFANFLQRYGAVKNGNLLAPRLALRAMYKARWNMIHELPPTYAFERIERLAYYGWLALHTDGASRALRQTALEQYQAAGGSRTAEARGVFDFAEGRYDRAIRNFQIALQRRVTLRLRNYLLAAQKSAAISNI